MPLNKRGLVRLRLSVWFSAASWCAKAARVAGEDVDASRVHRRQRVAAIDQVDRRTALGARFGQQQVPPPKAKRGQRTSGRRLAGAGQPASAGGRRSSGGSPRTAIARDRLAARAPRACPIARHRARAGLRPMEIGGTAVRSTKGSVTRTRSSVSPLQFGSQALDVDGDVGQFRHRRSVPARAIVASSTRRLRRAVGTSAAMARLCASPRCCKPATVPRRSGAERFWLTFHLPTHRSIGISMPTIALSICSM